MLSISALETLLLDLESDCVERKAGLGDRDKIRQAICAFANDLPHHQMPGVIFIGAKDDGKCAHFSITDQVLLTLADMRSNGDILPFPVMTVQKLILQECEMAVIEVQPTDSPPVRFDGRVWVRIGPRRAIATAEEERRLVEKNRSGNLPFDRYPVQTATLADLDIALFTRMYLPAAVAPDVLAENQRSIEQQLASLHFLTKNGLPNTVAMLTFGKNPRLWIPGAYVQFVRFEGTELVSTISDQKEVTGPLPDLLRQLDEISEAHIILATQIAGQPRERRFPDYPLVALQQLLRNAILHRTYEATNAPVRFYWFADRVEILSPGGPYGQVTPENFGQPGITDYRNPSVGEAMKTLGFIQRFGIGIPLAQQSLAANGNPPAEFMVNASTVTVRLWGRR